MLQDKKHLDQAAFRWKHRSAVNLVDDNDLEHASGSIGQERTQQTQVWDLPVRIFHWTLVVSILGAYITHRLGVTYFSYHAFFGYVVLIAIAFRILWGVIGSYHAKFSSFVKGPRLIIKYASGLIAGRHVTFAGHNPLGALMVLAFLGMLCAQALTGLFGTDEIMNAGPFNGAVNKDWGLYLTSIHRRLFYVIVAAAVVHVLAVLFHSVVFKERLIKAMFSGKKAVLGGDTTSPLPNRILNIRAALLFLGLSILLAVIVKYAAFPASSDVDF